jgi:hypothetical protein
MPAKIGLHGNPAVMPLSLICAGMAYQSAKMAAGRQT